MAMREIYGCQIEEQDGKIVSISPNKREDPQFSIHLHQTVLSNGRFARRGLYGVVIEIEEPFTHSHTDDVIVVEWKNDTAIPMSDYMKFKDIFFAGCLCDNCAATRGWLNGTTAALQMGAT